MATPPPPPLPSREEFTAMTKGGVIAWGVSIYADTAAIRNAKKEVVEHVRRYCR